MAVGDAVKAGDVLIEYDADELAKEKQLAELSLKQERETIRIPLE